MLFGMTQSTDALNELDVPKSTWKTWAPSAALFVAGACTTTAGLQVGLFFDFFFWILDCIPWILFAMGLGLVACSIMLSRGRNWAAWLGTGLVLFTTLCAFGWNLFLIIEVMLSPLNWCMLLTTGLACVTTPISIGETRRLSRARAALYSDP